MTQRDQEVLDFIVAYRREYHYSPTLREIGDGVKLKSPASVQRHVIALINCGMLERIPDKMRTLVPVEATQKMNIG